MKEGNISVSTRNIILQSYYKRRWEEVRGDETFNWARRKIATSIENLITFKPMNQVWGNPRVKWYLLYDVKIFQI